MSKQYKVIFEYITPANVEAEVLTQQPLRDPSEHRNPSENGDKQNTSLNDGDTSLNDGDTSLSDGDTAQNDGDPFDGNQLEEAEAGTFVPVMTVTKKEAVYTKGDLQLQKISVTEDISDNDDSEVSIKMPNPVYSRVHSEVITSPQPIRIDPEEITPEHLDNNDFEQEKEPKEEEVRRRSRIPQRKFRQTVDKINKARRDSRENEEMSAIFSNWNKYSKPPPPATIEDTTAIAPEDEFDIIYDEIVDSDAKVLEEEIVVLNVDTIEDPEHLETDFAEILNAYDNYKLRPIDIGQIKPISRLVKQKSLHDIEIRRPIARRYSHKDILFGVTDKDDTENETGFKLNISNKTPITPPPTPNIPTETKLKSKVVNKQDSEPDIKIIDYENETSGDGTILSDEKLDKITEKDLHIIDDDSKVSITIDDNQVDRVEPATHANETIKEKVKVAVPIFNIEDSAPVDQNDSTSTYTVTNADPIVSNQRDEYKLESSSSKTEMPGSSQMILNMLSQIGNHKTINEIVSDGNDPINVEMPNEDKLNEDRGTQINEEVFEKEESRIPIFREKVDIIIQQSSEENNKDISDEKVKKNPITSKIAIYTKDKDNAKKQNVDQIETAVPARSVNIRKEPDHKLKIDNKELSRKIPIPMARQINKPSDRASLINNKAIDKNPTTKDPKVKGISTIEKRKSPDIHTSVRNEDTLKPYTKTEKETSISPNEENNNRLNLEAPHTEKDGMKYKAPIKGKVGVTKRSISTDEPKPAPRKELVITTPRKAVSTKTYDRHMSDSSVQLKKSQPDGSVPIPNIREANCIKKEIKDNTDVNEDIKEETHVISREVFEPDVVVNKNEVKVVTKPELTDPIKVLDVGDNIVNDTTDTNLKTSIIGDSEPSLQHNIKKAIETDSQSPAPKEIVENNKIYEQKTDYRKQRDYVPRLEERLQRIKSINEETRSKKAVAETELIGVRGKVHQLISSINSIEKKTTENKMTGLKDRPRAKVVSTKIALFERAAPSVRSDDRITPTPTKADVIKLLNMTTTLSEEEYNSRIEELRNSKEKYGRTESMTYVTLRNGVEMPVLALGTALLDQRLLPDIIGAAIELGYRAIDTAYIYGNEKEVGEAIRAKIDDGTVTREDMFITSKLWSTYHRQDLVEQACRASLTAMGLDYFDLYLIHNPMSFKEGGDAIPKIANVIQYSEYDYLDAWYGMEGLITKGLAKSIGVSNFNATQLAKVVERGRVKPVVNQVECHPYLSQARLSQTCVDRQVRLSCYGVLGSKGTPADLKGNHSPVIDDPLVQVMAAGLTTSPARLLVRYQIDSGHSVVVKASTGVHLWDNLQALRLGLSQPQVDALTALNRNKRTYTFKGMGDTHRNYPFNTPY